MEQKLKDMSAQFELNQSRVNNAQGGELTYGGARGIGSKTVLSGCYPPAPHICPHF